MGNRKAARRGLLAAALLAGLGSAALAGPGMEFTQTQKDHWAWKTPVRPAIPKVKNTAWIRTPIDAFILAKLEARGLQPAPPADPRTLIRRVTYDLTGLPPTPEEVDAFLRDCEAESLPAKHANEREKGRGQADSSGQQGSVAPKTLFLPQSAPSAKSADSPPASPSPFGAISRVSRAIPERAYQRLVERLLASPAYGERWARHWLDLARYADTNGYEHDEVRPDMWRYRDYVVRSLNADKPYDRFIQEQLAGDELWPTDPDALVATGFNLLGPDMTDAADQAVRRQNTLNDMTDTAGLVFLGFTVGCARCHDHKYEPIPQSDYYRLQAFFARARFERELPIASAAEQAAHAKALQAADARVRSVEAQVDALAGPVREAARQKRLAALPEDVQTAFRLPDSQRTADQKNLVRLNRDAVEPPDAEVEAALPDADCARYRELAKELAEARKARPKPLPVAMALRDDAQAPVVRVLERGELSNPGPQVRPGVPVILAHAGPGLRTEPDAAPRRADLARWIASPQNPLTARVLVNRVWQHHFGRGLVPSPSDFGLRGDSPTHPELLDWLAFVFTQSPASGGGDREKERLRDRGTETRGGLGWSLKRLHRLILLSSAYQQSSNPNPLQSVQSVKSVKSVVGSPASPNPQSPRGHPIRIPQSSDPDNELFSRMNRQRLEAEAVRDAALAVSGRLNPKAGGPGVLPPLPADFGATPRVWPVTRDKTEHVRRSLYLFVRRNLLIPALEVFDAPDTNLSCARREQSTTAPQALALMNAPEMREHARHFAGRVLAGGGDVDAQVARAYLLALSRPPTVEESRLAREFLQKQAALLATRPAKELALPVPPPEGAGPAAAAMTDFCLALLNLNEFVYVD